jgi:acetolactate synthase-1/2/3 large subunit
VTTRHELAAVYMAEGMSYGTGGPGVAVLAGGPELTDALTGLAKAFYSNTPLLVVSGCNPPAKRDRGFPQDMDQLHLVRPFTKWCRCCYDASRIPEYIAAARRHALNGRPAPVYVEIPYDAMEATVSSDDLFFPELPEKLRSGGSHKSIEKAIAVLADAKRPLAIAGSGVFWSQAEEQLVEFVKRSRVPLLTTNAGLAMKLPSDLVLGYGSVGISSFALNVVAEADVLLLLGTRINFSLGFGQEPFLKSGQKIVQIDIEASEIGDRRKIDVPVCGDLREILTCLNEQEQVVEPSESWLSHLEKERKSLLRQLEPMLNADSTPIHPLRLINEIQNIRDPETFLVLDGANSILWALLGLNPLHRGRTIVSPIGDLEAIGAGIPHAVALKIANPDKQVVLHVGDGSAGFHTMEFETAVRCGVPFVAVVHNDGGWGMTRDMQLAFHGKELGNQLGIVRYDRVVESLGGHGEYVERPEEIGPAIERALESQRPACVNVAVDPVPKSPGLVTYMLLEVMLGQSTFYDRIPVFMRKLKNWHLDGFVSPLMRRYIDKKLNRGMT